MFRSAIASNVQPANSSARKVATLFQTFAAASKSASIAWTVLGVSTRAEACVLFSSGICALGPLASAASTSGLSR